MRPRNQTEHQEKRDGAAVREEEKRLLERVLKGDQQAWTEFCRRYENLIVSCVVKVLRRYNAAFCSEDLADLVAEVWLVLLRDDMRKLRLYDADRGYRLASWVGLMATNCTIDQLRTRTSEQTYLDDVACPERLLVDVSRPDQGIEEREIADLARRALDRLSSEERAFVFSCFHEERRPEELAAELGITINTIYSRKFKIREKLIRIVADLDAGDAAPALAA
jgi:RNA polymerase sigma-70 factor (ECF subfamily)